MTTRSFDNPRLDRAMLDGNLTMQSKSAGTGDYVITKDDPAIIYWTPAAGTNTLRMPDKAVTVGRIYFIRNLKAANGGIINDSDGSTALLSATAFAGNEFAILHNDNGTWRALHVGVQ